MHIKSMITSGILIAAHSSSAYALGSVQSGVGPNGIKWTASSHIIGRTSTGDTPPRDSPNTAPGRGNPIFLAPNSAGYSGVVGLLTTTRDGSEYLCSGTLVGNRSVVTAGHCVSGGGGAVADDIVRTQVFFQDDASSNRDERFFDRSTNSPPAGVTAIDVSNYTVHQGYVGDRAVDQNDIAVLTLAEVAPAFAKRYEIYTDDLTGKTFNVAGYGLRSSAGGEGGTSYPNGSTTGFRRQGENVFDFAWGNKAFDGFYTDQDVDGDWYLGTAEIGFSFVADFDNGLPAQDAACLVAQLAGLSASAADNLGFCTLGVGDLEANTTHGDSGGGAFIDGKLASVSSYGLSFTSEFGDYDGVLNSGFGEFGGYVPTFIHADFIRNAIAAVPEPATWAQMLLGFGIIGAATRRRRRSLMVA